MLTYRRPTPPDPVLSIPVDCDVCARPGKWLPHAGLVVHPDTQVCPLPPRDTWHGTPFALAMLDRWTRRVAVEHREVAA